MDGNKVAPLVDVRVFFAKSADVTEEDQIANITDRNGNILFAGRFRIDGPVQFKHTHREANLKRVG